MPVTTDNGKLAVMELDLDWEPGLPLSPSGIGQAEQQQLLWGFPEILWGEPPLPPVRIVCLAGADRSQVSLLGEDLSQVELTGADRSWIEFTLMVDC